MTSQNAIPAVKPDDSQQVPAQRVSDERLGNPNQQQQHAASAATEKVIPSVHSFGKAGTPIAKPQTAADGGAGAGAGGTSKQMETPTGFSVERLARRRDSPAIPQAYTPTRDIVKQLSQSLDTTISEQDHVDDDEQ